jgi:hypothetical protein
MILATRSKDRRRERRNMTSKVMVRNEVQYSALYITLGVSFRGRQQAPSLPQCAFPTDSSRVGILSTGYLGTRQGLARKPT